MNKIHTSFTFSFDRHDKENLYKLIQLLFTNFLQKNLLFHHNVTSH
jgi:hypothetical protein